MSWVFLRVVSLKKKKKDGSKLHEQVESCASHILHVLSEMQVKDKPLEACVIVSKFEWFYF